MRFSIFCFLAFIFFSITACENQTEEIDTYDFQSERLKELLPLQVGKYITYRVDSTVFPNFGRAIEVHKYRMKDVVDATITDNLGRQGYRINRYITDSTGNNAWKSSGTYVIVPLEDHVEVIENNLRITKLQTPLRVDYSWKGNRYLPNNPYNYSYGTENFKSTENWDFVYTNFGDETVNNTIVKDVWTVEHLNDVSIIPGGLSSTGISVEKYAKGIGLVYKELTLWEEQANTGGSSPYKIGFGVKMWMVDHN